MCVLDLEIHELDRDYLSAKCTFQNFLLKNGTEDVFMSRSVVDSVDIVCVSEGERV